jgi:hypothetical protein
LTKDELSQLDSLRKEIFDLQRRKREAEDRATATTGFLDGMPHASGTSDKVSMFGGDAAWYDMQLDLAIRRYAEQFRKIWMFIEEIQDSQMRMIFRFKYIDGMIWQKVAFEIGETDESYPRRKHNNYLKLAENAE